MTAITDRIAAAYDDAARIARDGRLGIHTRELDRLKGTQ